MAIDEQTTGVELVATLDVPGGDIYKDQLCTYVEQRTLVNPFLRAVLQNNLKTAIGYASHRDILFLKGIMHFCHWHVPGNSWGSERAVNDWLGGAHPDVKYLDE